MIDPDAGATPFERLAVAAQYLLPQHALSRIALRLTRSTRPAWKNLLIRSFMRRFDVDLGEAGRADAAAYACFNDFFTRALKPGARPIDASADAIVSPVDGTISQIGAIRGGRIVQAKGIDYSVQELLGARLDAGAFADGAFATLYLAPHNYHRVHLPAAARLTQMAYVPGSLFSVNPASTRCIRNLFARNERIACCFESAFGPMVVCMVGALFVGSIDTVWHGTVTPSAARKPAIYDYRNTGKRLDFEKGAEIARFNMGSTVIVLLPADSAHWEPSLTPGSAVQVGRRIGRLKAK